MLHLIERKTPFLLFFILFLTSCAVKQGRPVPNANLFSTLAQPRYGHAAVTIGDKTYVIGGSNNSGFHTSLEIIDNNSLETQVHELNLTTRRYTTAVWDGEESIYVFGGYTQYGRISPKVEVINTKTLTVSSPTSMPAYCYGLSAARISTDIYITGGHCVSKEGRRTRVSDQVLKYSLSTNDWTQVNRIKRGLETKTIAVNNKLYMFGGYNEKVAVTDAMVFDPASGAWSELPDMPYRTSAHSVVAIGNQIYVLGDYKDMTRSLVFDIKAQSWTELDLDFKPVRHSFAVNTNDKVLLIGGNTASRGQARDYIQTFTIK